MSLLVEEVRAEVRGAEAKGWAGRAHRPSNLKAPKAMAEKAGAVRV